MLRIEFEERTGVRVSEDEFTKITEDYMNSELDKDQFCKLWKKNELPQLFNQLVEILNKLSWLVRDMKRVANTQYEIYAKTPQDYPHYYGEATGTMHAVKRMEDILWKK